MRKYVWLGVGLLAFGLAKIGYTACANTDIQCYTVSGTQVYRLDASGNETVGGNATVTGNQTVTGTQTTTGTSVLNGTQTVNRSMIYAQQQVTQISSITVIVPSSVYLVLSSSGLNVTMSGLSPGNGPVISTSTATNGQFIILASTASGAITNGSITLSSGTASALDLGAATRVINIGKKLGLIYDSTMAEWVETFYGNN